MLSQHFLLVSCCLILLFSRLLWTKDLFLIKTTILCVLCGTLIICDQKSQWRPLNLPTTCDLVLQVQPDKIKVNGQQVVLTGTTAAKQLIIAYYQLKPADEQLAACLKTTTKPVSLAITGKPFNFAQPTNENEFNQARYYASKKIRYGVKIKQIASFQGEKSSWRSLLSTWRAQLQHYFQTYPPLISSLAQALIIGQLPRNNYVKTLSDLGVLYAFCLSGMHVFWLVWCLRQVGRWVRLTRETIKIVILLILPAFYILGGQSLSLKRAVLMTCLFEGSSLLKPAWQLSKLNCWSLVLLLNILTNPFSIFTAGFQLSYLLTLGLLLTRLPYFWLNFWLNFLSLPILLWHFYSYNMATPFWTWLISFLLQFILIPLLAIGLIVPPLTLACEGGLQLLFQFLQTSIHPTLIWHFGRPALSMVALLLVGTFYLIVAPKRKQWVMILGGMLCFNWCLLKYPLANELIAFDIGQGDATLIKTRFNRQITLIDTGGEFHQSAQASTSGERVLVNYFKSKGITQIDNLLLTHQDIDHLGNLPSLGQTLTIKRLFIPLGMETNRQFLHLLKQTNQPNIKVIPVRYQDKICQGSSEVLHPFTKGTGRNQDSLTVLYHFGHLNCFFSGDLDQAGEQKILQAEPNLRADLLKVGHHGSKTSTSRQLVAQLQPQLALISAGRYNKFGHPHLETLQTLANYHIPYYLTARDGMIKISWLFDYHITTQLREKESHE